MTGISLFKPRSWTQRGVVGALIAVLHLGFVAILLASRAPEPRPVEAAAIGITLLPQDESPAQTPLEPVPLARPLLVAPVMPELAIEVVEPRAPEVSTLIWTQPSTAGVVAAHPEPGPAEPTQVVADVEYRRAPPAIYPQVALRQRIEGTVYVQVVVSEEGQPLSVGVHRSCGHRALDEAAVTAVRGWLFKPYERNGVAQQVAAIVPVKFSLRVREAQRG